MSHVYMSRGQTKEFSSVYSSVAMLDTFHVYMSRGHKEFSSVCSCVFWIRSMLICPGATRRFSVSWTKAILFFIYITRKKQRSLNNREKYVENII